MRSGKDFENNLKKCVPTLIRLYDTTNGYSGVANPCDFIYYQYPFQFMIECKSVKGNSFPFSNLTSNQVESLDFHSHIYGNLCIIAVEYREAKEVYFFPYKIYEEVNKNGKKSISLIDARGKYKDYKLPCTYKRTNFIMEENDFKAFMTSLGRGL